MGVISDIVYWFCKIYFMAFWFIFLLSVYYQWDMIFMWYLSGVISIVYFIVTVMWYASQGRRNR